MKALTMPAVAVIAVLAAVVSSGCLQQDNPIGGQTDGHGCLTGAGFGWNSSFEKCMRPWSGEVQGESGTLPYEDAKRIAGGSPCSDEGGLKGTYAYNSATKTYWFDLDASRPQCPNPACVVSEDNMTAEINWRCTGLLPE